MQVPLQYTYTTIEREMVCAVEAISGLCEVLDRLGATTALIVCGPTILQRANVVQRVEHILGQRCVGRFAGVMPHAPVETLDDAVRSAHECHPDALVSVGGGSSHDTAKGVATLLAEGGRIHDYETHFEPPDTLVTPNFRHPKIPLVSEPRVCP